MRDITRLIIHCAATPADMDIGREEINEWHLDQGFSQIGYHFVIRRNGDLEIGRPLATAGAHARGFNSNSIGICLVGGVEYSTVMDMLLATNNFTPIQFETLKTLTLGLLEEYNLSTARVVGHGDLPQVTKACPSFNVHAWMLREGIVRV